MTNKKEMILKEINNDPYLAMKALETIYHNRTYVVYRNYSNKAVDTFYKTKRGAEGHINRKQLVSYYDDYSQEMTNCGSGLEVMEIQADEIADPTTNKKIWHDYIKKYWHIDFRFDNIIHEAKEIIIDNELLKWVENIIEDIKETDSFLHIEEFEEIEKVEIREEMAIVEEEKQEETTEGKEMEFDIDVEISFNEEKDGIEIKFNGKPERAVLENLKANGFRWSRYQKLWYAKDTEERRKFIKIFESVEIKESEPKNFDYPEIDIDDLEDYTIDPELSRRENDSSWIFRTKERNHTEELKNTLEHYQNQAIEIIEKTEDKETIYYIKRDLQRFKKAYHTNYIAMLGNRANNPSWAVTGRSGRNASRDQKAADRYSNLMNESIEIVKEFERTLERHENRIRAVTRKAIHQNIENTDLDIDFKVETKEIEYLKVKQKVRTYNYKNYMIAKLWGCFRMFKDGKELPREVVDLRTTDTLKTAKKALQMIINKENQGIQEAI